MRPARARAEEWRRLPPESRHALMGMVVADLCGELDQVEAINADLLEALEVAMSWIDAWDPNFADDPEWFGEDEPKIRAAIAKAKP